MNKFYYDNYRELSNIKFIVIIKKRLFALRIYAAVIIKLEDEFFFFK